MSYLPMDKERQVMSKFQDELRAAILDILRANQKAFKTGQHLDGVVEAIAWQNLESLIARCVDGTKADVHFNRMMENPEFVREYQLLKDKQVQLLERALELVIDSAQRHCFTPNLDNDPDYWLERAEKELSNDND